jgi:hypothetical protein
VSESSADPDWDLVIDFGTAATVILATKPGLVVGKTLQWRFLVREVGEPVSAKDGVELLASDILFDPEMLSVTSVGHTARPTRANAPDHEKAGLRHQSSLKRYIDMRSRAADRFELEQLREIVAGYLAAAIRAQRTGAGDPIVGKNSRITASVPNSFNCSAIDVVRGGVARAIWLVWRVAVDPRRVETVREGAAAAHVAFGPQELLSSIPVAGFPSEARPKWRRVPSTDRQPAAEPAASPTEPADSEKRDAHQGAEHKPAELQVADGERKLALVLDVGAGTTDLTMVDVHARGDRVRCDVVMNAGVPLGGDDVDRIILASLTNDLAVFELAPTDYLTRHTALRTARALKECPPKEGIWQELKAKLETDFIRPEKFVAPRQSQGWYEERLKILVELSVRCLFHLVPAEFKEPKISVVLLTGRGSQLPELRSAVVEEAKTWLECENVFSLETPNQLKLAVALGCAVISSTDLPARRNLLPARTLGRILLVWGVQGGDGMQGGEPIVLDAATPVPLRHPLLVRFRLAPGHYWVRELRVGFDAALPRELNEDEMSCLGLTQDLARGFVPDRRSIRPTEDLLVVCDTETERYYVAFDGVVRAAARFEPRGGLRDPLSGLPLGFPG